MHPRLIGKRMVGTITGSRPFTAGVVALIWRLA
jgi:hypothetical protein